MDPIHITSEIGKMKTVILKRPGKEIENFTPRMMSRLLFDETPYLPIAQKEHDTFASVLKQYGVNVLYLEKMAKEALNHGGPQVKSAFLDRMLTESNYPSGVIHDALKEYLNSMDTQTMVNKIIAGVRKNELHIVYNDLASSVSDNPYPFYMDPMPNIYFTRDMSAFIGNGVSINHMTFAARKRESLFNELILNYHPMFEGQNIPVWRNRNHTYSHIEGGDEQVLSEHVIAIGISQRTTAKAIQEMAQKLFQKSSFNKVIAIQIPHNHAMMHLDTVFTMVNYDQFTMYPGILNQNDDINIYVLTPGKDGKIEYKHRTNLKQTLKDALHLSELDIIPTGNGDPIMAEREQWNDGSNTLTIAPGTVITYDRNYVSNRLLKEHGINVITVPSSELSRGRGGPRCMSCPVVRADI
ncbi:arginine deiminase [Philodulcilactobacillus myokoensis]|uniref:Arginine deiminase n=1 Tax=Philodulcilactobacillus myokoensis TaxID=2929573 RepID=A0A9W6ETS4_9LACO|nr:arginine deiminase [Philodulcilactobacillus myokoensis]GLB47587.1 arginine deiminase [Philodulcilactobacillus myokoensis]